MAQCQKIYSITLEESANFALNLPLTLELDIFFSSKSEQSESLNPKIFNIAIANLITEYKSQSWQETRT